MKEKKIEVAPDSLLLQADRIERDLKSEIARNLWGDNQRYQILIESDPALVEAMTYFDQAADMARRELEGSLMEPGPAEPKKN